MEAERVDHPVKKFSVESEGKQLKDDCSRAEVYTVQSRGI